MCSRVRRLDYDRQCAEFQHGGACGTFGRLTQFEGLRRPSWGLSDFVTHLVKHLRPRCGMRLQRTAVLLRAEDVLGTRTGLLVRIHEDVVDVGLAIGDAHDLRLRACRREFAGQSIALQPPITLLLFDRERAAFERFAQTLRRAIEVLDPDHAQTSSVECDRELHMLIPSEALLGIQTSRVFRRMIGEVQLRRILHDEHDRVLPHSPLRGLEVRLENLLR